ncbi:hypothetical protein [Rhizobium aethiopicum]|uniref:hypothetical protein n=1 Tax=Rhizobium aethiopicum TaxID=1138170 RepID=UPI001AEDF844|nr:hypothetical protein [Rhizobium aethiopicum]
MILLMISSSTDVTHNITCVNFVSASPVLLSSVFCSLDLLCGMTKYANLASLMSFCNALETRNSFLRCNKNIAVRKLILDELWNGAIRPDGADRSVGIDPPA